MNEQQAHFEQMATKVHDRLMDLVRQANTDNAFDVENPILCLVFEEDGEPVLRLFNPSDGPIPFDSFPPSLVYEAFKGACQLESTQQSVLGAVLAGGWQKDPKTMERTAEVISIMVEDSHRSKATWIYKMERPEDPEQPVDLSLLLPGNGVFLHDCDYEHTGRMDNIFDLEPVTEEETPN